MRRVGVSRGARKIVVACVSPKVRAAMLAAIEAKDQKADLEDLQACPDGSAIQFEEHKERRGGKRAPSAYNMFVKTCIPEERKGKRDLPVGAAMQACAVKWRTSPQNPKRKK